MRAKAREEERGAGGALTVTFVSLVVRVVVNPQLVRLLRSQPRDDQEEFFDLEPTNLSCVETNRTEYMNFCWLVVTGLECWEPSSAPTAYQA